MEFEIEPLGVKHAILDEALAPIMCVGHACPTDEMWQETHPWHIQEIDPDLIDPDLAVDIYGKEQAHFLSKNTKLPFFHFPILGGWKNYALLSIDLDENFDHWFLGWRIGHPKRTPIVQLNRLPIYDPYVKTLTGLEDTMTRFFAVGSHGKQIPIKLLDEGRLFDKKYPDARLL